MQPLILTTEGIGQYRCSACKHYGKAGAGPDASASCAARGVPPDSMPCAFSPKRPERFFSPVETPQLIKQLLGQLSLPETLVLSALLPSQIDLLVQREALNLPYRPDELVSFVHNQTLVTAPVVTYTESTVTVLFEGETLILNHAQVIPPKRKNLPSGENLDNSSTS